MVEQNTIDLFKKILNRLKPPEKLSISEWADKYRVLSVSAEAGKWSTNRTPYLKKIMDCITDVKIRKVVIMSCVQIGKSEVLLNTMGYYIHIDPSPIMMVQPTVESGKDFSKERITPMIRDTSVLRNIIKDDKKKNSSNTILKKQFAGGFVVIVGANSPVGLASRAIKILAADEIDRWSESAGIEGDPLTLAEKRTTTFPHSHKKIYTSTPTIDKISRIQHEFKLGTMEEWEVPCPSCGKYHKLEWNNIKYSVDKDGKLDKTKAILAVCPSCGVLNNEYAWKSGKGKWVEHAHNEQIKSFHLSSLISPWKSWEEIVETYLSSKDDPEMLKAWTNTELGEVWVDESEAIDDIAVSKHRELYNCIVPKDVLIITAGVDVQDDRFEMEIVGWGKDKISWGIEYKVIYGDTSLPETWENLDMHLQKIYTDEKGIPMKIERVCIDSGGHRVTECYTFCKPREYRGVFSIKGIGGQGIPIIHRITQTKKIKNNLFILGVDGAKSTLYSRLIQNDKTKAGYCYFPLEKDRNYTDDYFKGLTSEVKTTIYVKGKPKIQWVKKSGVRNEPLDCRVYATAAMEIFNPDFEYLEKIKGKTTVKKRKVGTISKGVEV